MGRIQSTDLALHGEDIFRSTPSSLSTPGGKPLGSSLDDGSPFEFDHVALRAEGKTLASSCLIMGNVGVGKSYQGGQILSSQFMRANHTTGKPLKISSVSQKVGQTWGENGEDLGEQPEAYHFITAYGGTIVDVHESGLNLFATNGNLSADSQARATIEMIRSIRRSMGQPNHVTEHEYLALLAAFNMLQSKAHVRGSCKELINLLRHMEEHPELAQMRVPTQNHSVFDITSIDVRDIVAILQLIDMPNSALNRAFCGDVPMTQLLDNRYTVFNYGKTSTEITDIFQGAYWRWQDDLPDELREEMQVEVMYEEEIHSLVSDNELYGNRIAELLKLIRSRKLLLIMVTHRIDDMLASGNERVTNMLEDVGMAFVGQMGRKSAAQIGQIFQLAPKHVDRITNLRKREFAFIVKGTGYEPVFFRAFEGTPLEVKLFNTEQARDELTGNL